jgi:hypothetical protein
MVAEVLISAMKAGYSHMGWGRGVNGRARTLKALAISRIVMKRYSELSE